LTTALKSQVLAFASLVLSNGWKTVTLAGFTGPGGDVAKPSQARALGLERASAVEAYLRVELSSQQIAYHVAYGGNAPAGLPTSSANRRVAISGSRT